MSDVLGSIIAGGASSRFGSPKALAELGGVRVVDRVANALRQVCGPDDVVAIANDAALGAATGLPWRSDALHDIGALAGVHAALLWARERGMHGVLAVACDMPFIEAPLLAAILSHAPHADAVLPESEGRRGVEPLCALYATTCIDAIESAAARGDGRMIGFHADVDVVRVPLEIVRRFGDPDLLFRNLNTRDDLAEAERVLRERSS